MNPKEKAMELALKFCSPSDVFCPNPASLRNAEKCVDEILTVLQNPVGYTHIQTELFWIDVEIELKKM